MQELNDPFKDIPQSEMSRTTINIPLKVIAEIKNIECKTGVLQSTIDILLSKLYEQLRQRNLETGDRHAYHHALNNCTLTLGGASSDGDNTKRGSVAKASTRAKSPKSRKAADTNE